MAQLPSPPQRAADLARDVAAAPLAAAVDECAREWMALLPSCELSADPRKLRLALVLAALPGWGEEAVALAEWLALFVAEGAGERSLRVQIALACAKECGEAPRDRARFAYELAAFVETGVPHHVEEEAE